MSHYEQRLGADKAEIRRRVVAIGRTVEQALGKAVEALAEKDRNKAYQIVLGDLPINREIRAIDQLCHAFVAKHLPSAGHLRFVSAVLQMDVALERIGDYAVTISREAVQLSSAPPEQVMADIRALCAQSLAVLSDAVSAFEQQNQHLARDTKERSRETERRYGQAFRYLTQETPDLELRDAFALLMVFSRLQRVSDQAKNLCEETLFELTGETKPPKRYRVLFVDARDTLIGPLAVALARKAFPGSGEYDSVGFNAGDALAPELETLASELGLDLHDIKPAPLDASREALEKFHVIVCLNSEASKFITDVPYASAVLEWDLPRLSDPSVGSTVDVRLREVKKHLAARIGDLMVLLRGDSAQ